ncbi:lysosomal acid glucosylceramidase-like [Pieris rapae]|uniref:lysosomal acid glucosylceramidase-like n=1 Tax=Pieris rapae TaxID=64459 RepID=UPI001E27BAAA|nr:lysosomal acid glucosylceramidase-like [Pieris rapae]
MIIYLASQIIVFLTLSTICCLADLPCAYRQGDKPDRLVCVCNATYCDTIDRVPPPQDSYITYTSSKAGSRFLKGTGRIVDAVDDGNYDRVIQLYPDERYQTIHGFGGAATDAACIKWKSLPKGAQERFIESYFSKRGIEYTMIRVPVASSDFSTHPYHYNEYPENDKELTNFTYTKEDTEYKLPLIKGAMEVATDEISVVAAVWSPPMWMKVVDPGSTANRLKAEFYQTYANYHCEFVKLYEKAGVPIWGVSTSNEPINGAFMQTEFGPQDTIGWSVDQMKKWLKNNFGPTMRNCNGKKINILAMDDQRYLLPAWNVVIVGTDKEISKYVDGFAMHSYIDPYTPASIIDINMKNFPDKFVLGTEFSSKGSDSAVPLGDWGEGEVYAETILENLVSNYVGFIDWNLALDPDGGPNWAKNFVDAPIIINSTSGEFYKQPIFYVLGHFSKLIPRWSQRIKSVRQSPIHYTPDKKNIYDSTPPRKYIYDHVAFVTVRNTIVVVIANYDEAQNAAIMFGSKQVTVFLEANSIVSVEFPYSL